MRTLPPLAVLLLCAGLAANTVHAQAPGPAAEPIPFDIPYGTPITLEHCKKVLEVAPADARRRNWKMAVAIADPSGNLVCYERLDGTMHASAKISQAKAWTAATFRRPTRVFFDAMETGHPYVSTFDGIVASPGGIPLVENGRLIGAIGVSGGSGGSGPQDEVVAKAGAETVK